MLLWPCAVVSYSTSTRAAVRPPRGARSSTARAAADAAASSVALAFGDALAKAWQQDAAPLRQLLSGDAAVETPIWNCTDAADYLKQLGEAAEFFSRGEAPPRLTVLSDAPLDADTARVEWVLGVEWPSLWRARVNILGESVVRYDLAGGERAVVREVRETWHQSPMQAFQEQVLPRRRDWMSLWNSPTAEHIPQKVERVAQGYEVRRLPPMLALQAETLETGDAIFVEQAPLAPAFCFTGQVKRAEWYSTVSPSLLERASDTLSLPGGMEQPAQRRRWILPMPTRFGIEADDMPPPDVGVEKNPGFQSEGVQGASIQYVRRPSQRIAVARIKGYPSDEVVLGRAPRPQAPRVAPRRLPRRGAAAAAARHPCSEARLCARPAGWCAR